MFDARKIRLRRISEEIVLGRIGLVQQCLQSSRVEVQHRGHQGRVGDGCAFGSRKLANSVYRVMVIKGKQEAASRRERE